MGQRLDLHAILSAIPGVVKAYFQPPSNIQMQYPCIVYKRDDIDTEFANNKPYSSKTRYQVTVIDTDPDSDIHKHVGKLPMSSYDRFFTADNLNHDVYTLFF